MAEAEAAGGVSKTAVKNAKADAGKAAKKKPDPEGLALLEAGEKAMVMKDLEKALALFKEAEAKCKASEVTVVPKEKKPKAPPAEKEGGAKPAADGDAEEAKKPKLYLSQPTENQQAKPADRLKDGVKDVHNYAANASEQLAAHLKATGGKFRTRFPPEPNGYLHIGHAKAMNFNFGQARIATELGSGGETVMRFDDTNPTAEKQEFIDSILDNVKWLGHTPCKVTYSSDYFQELHDLAVQLIKEGGAFVCHQTAAQIKGSRDLLRLYHGRGLPPAEKGPLPKGAASPYRSRTVDENLREFRKMRQGRYAEGEAFLRLTGDLLSENSSMWDLAAYRIMYHAHPKTGDAWCIYPTYDYTHCIVDSLENITHSLCTLEFAQRQAVDGPYYHLLHGLHMYKPATWEYSRLNLTHAVMSKRKLKFLVVYNYVSGWDDPRLCTLDGLRRRGFSGSVVNRFCQEIGVTRAAMTAKIELLEQIARRELDASSPRRFGILHPLRIELSGVPAGGKTVEVPNHPKEPSFGTRKLTLSNVIYIECDEYRPELKDDTNFFGLAVGREVGLLSAGVNITVTQAVNDATGELSHLLATVDMSKANRPKGNLHWLSADDAVKAECRVYDVLFTPEDPEQAAKDAAASGDGGAEEEEEEADDEEAGGATATGGAALPPWLKLLNPASLVVEHAMVEKSLALAAAKPNLSKDRPSYQLQRVGFFCVDDTSTVKNPIFNRVVALKEDKEKRTLA